MKWAKSLKIRSNETVEQRLLVILNFLSTSYRQIDCVISSVDATGVLGNTLTHELNQIAQKSISIVQLISLMNEDGQVFELHLSIKSDNQFEIFVVDGSDVDIIGDGPPLPLTVIGEHIDVDLSKFGY